MFRGCVPFTVNGAADFTLAHLVRALVRATASLHPAPATRGDSPLSQREGGLGQAPSAMCPARRYRSIAPTKNRADETPIAGPILQKNGTHEALIANDHGCFDDGHLRKRRLGFSGVIDW
jgi:hypothetical protein